jgi:hypothetical protein
MKSQGDIEVLTLIIKRLKIQLRKVKVRYQASYCPYIDFSDIVLKTAKEAGIDLLVLTGNFENDLKSFFIDPFVQKVINRSRLPVLSIKPAFKATSSASSVNLSENWCKRI